MVELWYCLFLCVPSSGTNSHYFAFAVYNLKNFSSSPYLYLLNTEMLHTETKVKDKAIPVQAYYRPGGWVFQIARQSAPEFLSTGRLYPSGNIPGTYFY